MNCTDIVSSICNKNGLYIKGGINSRLLKIRWGRAPLVKTAKNKDKLSNYQVTKVFQVTKRIRVQTQECTRILLVTWKTDKHS